jgi:hypothetical protein
MQFIFDFVSGLLFWIEKGAAANFSTGSAALSSRIPSQTGSAAAATTPMDVPFR